MSEEILKQFLEMPDEELRKFIDRKQADCERLQKAIDAVTDLIKQHGGA